MISCFFSTVANFFQTRAFQQECENSSAMQMGVLAVLSAVGTVKIVSAVVDQCRHSPRTMLSHVVMKLPPVRKVYEQEVRKQKEQFRREAETHFAQFGQMTLKIPENGWSNAQTDAFLKMCKKKTLMAVANTHISGTIYSKSLDCDEDEKEMYPFLGERRISSFDSIAADLEHLSLRIEKITAITAEMAYLWNPLHGEFGIGPWIDRQVVCMVANMFGGKPNEVSGVVTSGGTESLMLSMRAYRNRGIKLWGHRPGEGVIVAPNTVHAAIIKAAEAYQMQLELVPTNPITGQVNIRDIESAVQKHNSWWKKRVVAIVGSAGSYPTGTVDPIASMAWIAQNNGCGMHVDCCLSAFIINHLVVGYGTQFLLMKGVTSLSADPHKNGWAAKGVSVAVFKDLEGQNPLYYAMYSIPGWSGGAYGTIRDAGSLSLLPSLNAFLTMVTVGQKTYQETAHLIQEATQAVKKLIGRESLLECLGSHDINVVAFRVRPDHNLLPGATYALSEAMEKHHVKLNDLGSEAVHFCVTARFASNPRGLSDFKNALDRAISAILTQNEQLEKQGKTEFPGKAKMYCALNSAIEPHRTQEGIEKYLENYFFGEAGAEDAVRNYLLAKV